MFPAMSLFVLTGLLNLFLQGVLTGNAWITGRGRWRAITPIVNPSWRRRLVWHYRSNPAALHSVSNLFYFNAHHSLSLLHWRHTGKTNIALWLLNAYYFNFLCRAIKTFKRLFPDDLTNTSVYSLVSVSLRPHSKTDAMSFWSDHLTSRLLVMSISGPCSIFSKKFKPDIWSVSMTFEFSNPLSLDRYAPVPFMYLSIPNIFSLLLNWAVTLTK